MATKIGGDGCYANALPHEEVFVLLARDAAAPQTIREWAHHRVMSGKNKIQDPEIQEALACAERMERQRKQLRAELGKA